MLEVRVIITMKSISEMILIEEKQLSQIIR